MSDANLLTFIHYLVRAIEIAGVSVIVVGALIATFRFARDVWANSGDPGISGLRSDLGRAILLGLEFLVAADIINTVAIEPTLQSLAVLAGIVAIRTFLSFSLEVELEGTWPWARQRKRSETN